MGNQCLYPCKDKECECSRCSHQLRILDDPYENQHGEIVYPGMCTYLSPPEPFEVLATEFEEWLRNRSTSLTPVSLTENQASPSSPNDTASLPKPRRGGASAYAGRTVAGFSVDQDSTKVTVKGRTFKISHNADKNLIDQVISAVQNCQHGFSIHLPPKDYNALSPDGKCFATLYVVREIRKGKGNRKYTGYACLK